MQIANFLVNFLRPSRINVPYKGEDLICVRFATYMVEKTWEGKCPYVWFHVSNEGSASGKQIWGAKQRNMGKWAGISDYVFMRGDKSFALEIKTQKGRLSESQKDFERWCLKEEITYGVAYSYEEAIDFVKKKGIVTV